MAGADDTKGPAAGRVVTALAAGALAVAAAYLAFRPRMLTWGAKPDEQSRPLPGDDEIEEPTYTSTRAITINAPADQVWPWLLQIGHDKGGFYSYDALENLIGLDVRSADTIRPEWQDAKPGEDYMTLDPEGSMKLTVLVADPPRAFVVRSGSPEEGPQPPGDLLKGEIAWTWGFYLEPLGERETRLIIRSRASWAQTLAARLAAPVMLESAHFIMEERMLRGIRDRAEGRR